MLMNLRPVDSRQRALSMFDMDGLDADASTEYISNAWANAGSSGIGRRNTHSEHLHLHLGAIAMWIPMMQDLAFVVASEVRGESTTSKARIPAALPTGDQGHAVAAVYRPQHGASEFPPIEHAGRPRTPRQPRPEPAPQTRP
jgi:hypothetical protein